MKITSAVIFALTSSCALAACQSPQATPKRAETVRLVKAHTDLADLGVAGYMLHQPLTTDAPGLIEFVDANRAIIGKMTSTTVRSETSVATTMTLEGLGNAEPLAVTDETVGDGTMTRVTIQRGTETTTFEGGAVGTFLIVAGGRIPVDVAYQAELSAALAHATVDPRFRVFVTLSQDPQVGKGMYAHKSALCMSVLGGATTACVTVCLAALSPAIPVTLPGCLLTCGIALSDLLFCEYESSTAVNDAQCDMNSPPGYIGRADATEHQCLQQCDASRCDGFCKNQPHTKGGYCSFNYCTCSPAEDEGDDGTGGDGTGDDGTGDDGSSDGSSGGGCSGSETWCDCTSDSGDYHGMVCGETPTDLIDACWNSCG